DIHGYRISQLFSSKIDPGEILNEYRTTRFPDRFYNLKIGIPWADLERRLDESAVLSLCTDYVMGRDCDRAYRFMGVDTGKNLHVVIMATHNDLKSPMVIHLEACHEFHDLDRLMEQFNVKLCVIDGLPETHATREFTQRNRGKVYMNFFLESQRGKANWDRKGLMVRVNRTEALDASRKAIREKEVLLPRRTPQIEEFAKHLAADAKVLDEDEETGIKKYRYIRTGVNHYSLAFTYAWLAKSKMVPAGTYGYLRI
ncbi:MAG: phage tail protein, partial [Candidatus Eisenbacteria bacterium]|nr:phage tail protein [Candidatus Eisenbacteria bacterium]